MFQSLVKLPAATNILKSYQFWDTNNNERWQIYQILLCEKDIQLTFSRRHHFQILGKKQI